MRKILAALLFWPCLVGAVTPVYYVDCSAASNGSGVVFSSPFNDTASLNWTNIQTDSSDILFKEGTTCTNTQLGGAGGFPSTTNIVGLTGNHIRIGVYSASTGTELLAPTAAQRVNFTGDGATRSEMVSLFADTFFDLNGFNISGGSNALQRGLCIVIGAIGAVSSSDITVSNTSCALGSTPSNTGTVYGFSAGGPSSGGVGSGITFSNLTVSGLVGTSSAVGVLCSNLDACNVINSMLGASTAPTTIGVLIQSSNDTRAITTGSTITGNLFSGNQYGIRYAPFGTSTTFAQLTGANWSNNTFNAPTIEGIYASLLTASSINNNKIVSPGAGTGAGAGIYLSAPTSGFVGSTNSLTTTVKGNTITDAGQFAIWVVGLHDLIINSNSISRCGTPALNNTFGRCIELADIGTTTRPAQTLTLSATSGSAITVTAGGAAFAATDLDKLIVGPPDNDGACRITAFTSTTVVTCNVLRPFLSTNVAASVWFYGLIAHNIQTNFNNINTAYGRQYSAAPGTEGVGIGFDNYTSLSVADGNYIANTDFGAIAINAGVGDKIIGNAIYNAGGDPAGLVGAASVRRTGIQLYYTGTQVWNNSINCNGNAYGISAENSTTTNPTIPAQGGISDYRNNLTLNCAKAGILGNSNDTASNNAYFKDAVNYEWMAQLSFSAVPTLGDLTVQTLDGASLTSDPLLIGSSSPGAQQGFRLSQTSPLFHAGVALGTYADALNRSYLTPPSIGAFERASGDSAGVRQAAIARPAAAARATPAPRPLR